MLTLNAHPRSQYALNLRGISHRYLFFKLSCLVDSLLAISSHLLALPEAILKFCFRAPLTAESHTRNFILETLNPLSGAPKP